MAENSEISWTENTFNPWIGCTKVSPGCANCYAERDWGEGSRRNRVKWGPNGTRSKTGHGNWNQPHRWNKQAEREGGRIRVFCASLADVFEEWTGPMLNDKGEKIQTETDSGWRDATMQDIRSDLFSLIDATPHLDWLLVTKRPENIRRFWTSKEWDSQDQADSINETGYLHRKNVWLLTSVENQEQADKRIPELLKCRDLAPVLGLSCEPLIGPVDLTEDENYLNPECWGDCACDSVAGYDPGCRRHGGDGTLTRHIDWVIAGGESGPGARPMHPDWARSLRDQCQAAGVPFHFKQWGEFAPLAATAHDDHSQAAEKHVSVFWNAHDETWRVPPKLEETAMYRVGKKAAGRLLDGREWDEFPKVGA